MKLTDDEIKTIERKRAKDRAKRGTVLCYDCAGTDSYSQSDCEVCGGSGELKRNGSEIQRRVRELEDLKKSDAARFDAMIAQVRGER